MVVMLRFLVVLVPVPQVLRHTYKRTELSSKCFNFFSLILSTSSFDLVFFGWTHPMFWNVRRREVSQYKVLSMKLERKNENEENWTRLFLLQYWILYCSSLLAHSSLLVLYRHSYKGNIEFVMPVHVTIIGTCFSSCLTVVL